MHQQQIDEVRGNPRTDAHSLRLLPVEGSQQSSSCDLPIVLKLWLDATRLNPNPGILTKRNLAISVCNLNHRAQNLYIWYVFFISASLVKISEHDVAL